MAQALSRGYHRAAQYGNPVMEGDRIVHPSGESGIVTLFPDETNDTLRWRIDYGYGPHRCRHSEVSEIGRAVVLDETGKVF